MPLFVAYLNFVLFYFYETGWDWYCFVWIHSCRSNTSTLYSYCWFRWELSSFGRRLLSYTKYVTLYLVFYSYFKWSVQVTTEVSLRVHINKVENVPFPNGKGTFSIFTEISRDINSQQQPLKYMFSIRKKTFEFLDGASLKLAPLDFCHVLTIFEFLATSMRILISSWFLKAETTYAFFSNTSCENPLLPVKLFTCSI